MNETDRLGEMLGTLLAYRRVLRAAVMSYPAPEALLQAIPMLREQAMSIALGEPGPDEMQTGVSIGMQEIEALIRERIPAA
jgi:hypothetical protein